MNYQKNYSIIYWFLGSVVFGAVIVLLVCYAAATDQWYKEVTSTPRYRAMIVDKLAENTVTIYNVTGSGRNAKISITEEP